MTLFILSSIIAMSIDRFVAIKYATKYKDIFSTRRCGATCACIWAFSFAFPFLYFAWNYIEYMMFMTHSAIFVALFIMVCVHVEIKRFLKIRSSHMVKNMASNAPKCSASSAESRSVLLQQKISRVYMVMLAFFVGIYTPAVVMIYILHFCVSCNCTFRHVLRDVSIVLVSANSCINPFILCDSGKKLQEIVVRNVPRAAEPVCVRYVFGYICSSMRKSISSSCLEEIPSTHI